EVAGRPAESLFERFDPRPFETGPLLESFRAELAATVCPNEALLKRTSRDGALREGASVILELTRAELDSAPEALERLSVVASVLETWLVVRDPDAAAELVASARGAVEEELDLGAKAEAFEDLERDAEAFFGDPGGEAPRVCRSLSNTELLTTEAHHRHPSAAGLRGSGSGEAAHDGRELAQRLCLAWLRQALLGSRLPAAPCAAHLALDPAGRLWWTGGGFVRPSPGWQERLAAYLGAVETQEPDAILVALVDLLDRPPEDLDPLRRRLRQLRPLREARDFAPVGRFASQLLLHWRWLAEEGGRPETRTTDFFRGTGLLEQTLRSLAPDFDPWPMALERIRLETELTRWRERLDPIRLGQDLRDGVAFLARWPRILDSATTALEGGLRVRLELPEETARTLGALRRDSRSRSALSLPLLLLAFLAAWAFSGLDRPLAEPTFGTPEQIRGLLLLLIGLCLGASRR
ncbi:MAG: AarF/UbiB family protein, partial [Holophagales bacterium]|nr:AarF/UbiB family protein [Holophagales bacterium]